MAPAGPKVLAVVGMTREARILTGTPTLVGGGDAARLAARLEGELATGAAGVVSFGLCGALDPTSSVGDLVIGEAVGDGEAGYGADTSWTQRLLAALPGARLAGFARAERPVASPSEKAQLHARTGAAAVDLESWVVARLACAFGLPFAIVRAVSDAADRALPHAARVGLGRDGQPAIGAVLVSLACDPLQLGALVRTALEAEVGFRALVRARYLLGPGLAGPDLD